MDLEIYSFEHIKAVVLSPNDARGILGSLKSSSWRGGVASINMGLTRAFTRLTGSNVEIAGGPYSVVLPLSFIEELSASSKVYVVPEGDKAVPAEIRAGSYYKLRPVEGGAPTLEIDGIHMHRIEGVDPWTDSQMKVKAARIGKGHLVLDSCTGLGYTAINAAKRGARVLTVEVDENVIYMARVNPWSRGLSDPTITVILGDILKVADLFPDNSFHRIIHDPPRLAGGTGELYSLELYRKFYRILRPGGILFHYTGEPGKRRGLKIQQGVIRRLLQAGFREARFHKQVQGVVAFK
ncbi:MAG: methyltransferase domain-containing protein [Desulfurococcales archaeon]|nr:methyltransferase domain-containing protein [Desulfurococcales archaeon]